MPDSQPVTSPAPAQEIAAEIPATSPAPSEQLKPQAHGGALLAGGRKGHRGGPGRPPEKLKIKWRGYLERPTTMRSIGMILKNPDHPQFANIFGKLAILVTGVPGKSAEAKAEGEEDILVSLDF